MTEFLLKYQLDIMQSLSSIAFIVALFVLITKTIPPKRKLYLFLMEICSAIWLQADRMSLIFDGVPGTKEYYLVRISNFIVFFMTVFVLFTLNRYLSDCLVTDGKMEKAPLALRTADYLAFIAMIMVVISQFTGLYYTVDANNRYQRAPLYMVSYIFPYFILMLQFYSIIRYGKKLRRSIAISIFLFDVVCLLASLLQFFFYGISITDNTVVIMVISIYIFSLIDLNDKLEEANRLALDHLNEERKSMKRLFEQTATAIMSAVDAKDRYTQGHSKRVAEYAKEIAKASGKSETECDEIYYAGLLHDVGKIGISDDIINKASSLTEEENEEIREHSRIGKEILSQIAEFPFLSTGAAYHHERFDGRGYPEGLKGQEIPEIARIIAVADTYDAMTSKRQYRDPMPQQTVKEEIVKGAGTQFDPVYADVMVDLINNDAEYNMREKEEITDTEGSFDLSDLHEMHFNEYKETMSDGIQLTPNKVRIRLKSRTDEGFDSKFFMPAIILFDSNDGCVHKNDRSIRNLGYLEYAEIWFDGHTVSTAARNMKTDVRHKDAEPVSEGAESFEIEAVRIKDHVRIKIKGERTESDVTVALPDSVRFSYISIAGEHCRVTDFEMETDPETTPEDYIQRIAEEVSYLSRMSGDLPNVQIEGYRSDYTKAVSVANGMRISFHALSLPTANLVWHCPFINLFYSEDKKSEGRNYREYALIRLDGGDGTNRGVAVNRITTQREESFKGWDHWKEMCKKGFDCEITFRRKRNTVTVTTENLGISVKCVTVVKDAPRDIYVSLTGDQVALTDIRIE